MESAARSMNIESTVKQTKAERAAQAHEGLTGAAPNETKELFHHTPGHESGKQAGRQAQKHKIAYTRAFFEERGNPEKKHDNVPAEREARQAGGPTGHMEGNYVDIEKKLDDKIAVLEKKQVELAGQIQAMDMAMARLEKNVSEAERIAVLATLLERLDTERVGKAARKE